MNNFAFFLGPHNQLEGLLSISACRFGGSTWQTSLRRDHGERGYWNNEQYERIYSSLKKKFLTESALKSFAKNCPSNLLHIHNQNILFSCEIVTSTNLYENERKKYKMNIYLDHITNIVSENC